MQFAPLVINFLLMVAMPVLLGWMIARRRRVSWRFFGIGAATFVLAQLGHIPFNYLVLSKLLAGMTLASQRAMELLTALFLGCSAGLFEEGARYLAYRFWARDARSWGKGSMMGAGHGGAESILLGVLGGLNVTILLGYRAGYFQGLVSEAQAPQVAATLNQLAAMPWYEMMLGAVERVFALGIQWALSLMVMRVFMRGRLAWLLAAFCWHALVDAAAVIALNAGGVYVSEAVAGLAALASLVIVYRLREPEPAAIAPEPLPLPQRRELTTTKPTNDKLEESRYL
jgi:uncharacterized membrane protein YhfC